MAQIIDGNAFSETLRARIGGAVAEFTRAGHAAPGLAVVLVGEDPASQVYVRSKGKRTVEAGMRSIEHKLPATVSEAELLALVAALNADPAVDGILVQLPLPRHISADTVIEAIDPAKDVDGFHPVNVGRLAIGQDAMVPCTPLGSLMLIKSIRADLTGLDAVVVGRSSIVGKPMAQLLIAESCTVTVAHSKTRGLPALCRRADILVAAVGRPEMIRGDWVKPGAIVIDVGINRVPAAEPGKTKLVGDVAYGEAAAVAGAITPVPGGVGPMTIACLLYNTLKAWCARKGLAMPALIG
ncbi:MAG: bifunctional methylenetetrahydrofolate dehydrogenase/methenyltetrahydrofolate cyclohydrolase FolD [Methylocystis sp.]|nr:bifunctional methylenetetrahydrofolate dehydrogenase/methenyltetrahydrofolate cyclohydrolase FolD [Methylocystis sp.]MCA3583936.1 bifunctional methylenetetrahydrofolate dehydrogenase/methenyltetrahydrofolate cyclohydrolase FolD [Methylocystis sp.]MCA3589726.1 bifunctional methylenetetrahydrofolate dehydrogenase/methenyltetrahydrofolate cyclohydrolase FolD [Methylocystis sp.]MCA3592440.1 bifunctional methylenetetrahydrofolate dehydrogenase/methenyltetrahydrofolate cyclohydrolase FolD [Methyloc